MFRLGYYGIVELLFLLGCVWEPSHGSEFGSFGFDIHHRFSEPVKAMLKVDGWLPEMGTVDFYTAMVHRDRFFHGRRLAGNRPDNLTTLTFVDGNVTVNIPSLGFLYYANVSVGTPASWYLVALDTGSGLFWLPCDCTSDCTKVLELTPSMAVTLNMYSLKASSTGNQLSCPSPSCLNSVSCSPCSYSITYLAQNTSSTGYLVEDVLHLTTDADPSAITDARIAFGCSVKRTGSLLETAAPTGLFGLSMDDISVPSMLAHMGLVANSFSMCFTTRGTQGIGRISFGDKGSSDQSKTPFDPGPIGLYNVSITHISVGSNASATQFSALFDTGTSFTLLTDPAYTILSELFDSQTNDRRLMQYPGIPFKYCYLTSGSLKYLRIPGVNLTMKGGHQFTVKQPAVVMSLRDGRGIYCLAVIKSSDMDLEKDVNIIGENFMTGYRVVFDREKMELGWKASNCDEATIPGTRSTPDALSASKHYCLPIFVTLLVQILSLHLIMV